MKYKLLLYAMKKPLDKMEPFADKDDQKKDINQMVRISTIEYRARAITLTVKERSIYDIDQWRSVEWVFNGIITL